MLNAFYWNRLTFEVAPKGISGGKLTGLFYAVKPIQSGITELRKMVMSGCVPEVGASPRILCVGEDRTLLDTRRSILERERYIVLSLSARQLPTLDPLPPITLAIVCHSVKGSVRGQAIDWLQRRLSRTRILLLDRTGGRYEAHMDLPRSSTQPQEMLKSVAGLIARIHLDDTPRINPSS